jgi:hypothetical protein
VPDSNAQDPPCQKQTPPTRSNTRRRNSGQPSTFRRAFGDNFRNGLRTFIGFNPPQPPTAQHRFPGMSSSPIFTTTARHLCLQRAFGFGNAIFPTSPARFASALEIRITLPARLSPRGVRGLLDDLPDEVDGPILRLLILGL